MHALNAVCEIEAVRVNENKKCRSIYLSILPASQAVTALTFSHVLLLLFRLQFKCMLWATLYVYFLAKMCIYPRTLYARSIGTCSHVTDHLSYKPLNAQRSHVLAIDTGGLPMKD